MLAVVLADLVDRDDAGVVEQGDGLGLVLEAAQLVVAGEQAGLDHLERDGPVEGDLPGLVDDAHAAAAQLPADLVVAEVADARGRWRFGMGWIGRAEVDYGVIARRHSGVVVGRPGPGARQRRGRRRARNIRPRPAIVACSGDLGTAVRWVAQGVVGFRSSHSEPLTLRQGRAGLIGDIGQIVVDRRPFSRAVGLEPAADCIDPASISRSRSSKRASVGWFILAGVLVRLALEDGSSPHH